MLSLCFYVQYRGGYTLLYWFTHLYERISLKAMRKLIPLSDIEGDRESLVHPWDLVMKTFSTHVLDFPGAKMCQQHCRGDGSDVIACTITDLKMKESMCCNLTNKSASKPVFFLMFLCCLAANGISSFGTIKIWTEFNLQPACGKLTLGHT